MGLELFTVSGLLNKRRSQAKGPMKNKQRLLKQTQQLGSQHFTASLELWISMAEPTAHADSHKTITKEHQRKEWVNSLSPQRKKHPTINEIAP